VSLLRRWLGGGGDAERAPPRGDPSRVAEVLAVLASVEPAVRADGGRIDLVAVEGGRVQVRLSGACSHCHASDLTLQGVLEPRLRAALPWFEGLSAS
jgi:NifU-like protein